MLAKLLVIALAGYAALVAYVFLAQHRMIYLPGAVASTGRTPADVGLEYEDVYVRARDGVRLHAWHVPGGGALTLLFFHGNAGDISHRLDTVRMLHELGPSVLIVDYRGYGRSEGRPTEAGTYADADAAWTYLTRTRGIAPERVVVFGRSLGGAIAAQLASRHTPRALVLESAFTSVPDLAARVYWFLPVRWLSRYAYPTRELVRDVRCPVLVVHSRDDEIVPFAHGEAIYEAANEPRTLVEVAGGHNDAYLRIEHGAYRDALERFLRRSGDG